MIVKESQAINKVETTIAFTDTVTPYREDETILSTITPSHRLNDLAIGEVGKQSSIMSNVTIIKNLKTTNLEEPKSTSESDADLNTTSVVETEGGNI